jgi:chromosomal replication initiation ATPase DnaA
MKRELNFENFYIHDGNEIAYLAAQKVIEFPGELFNPFYIYGDTGLGKTHLLRAIHSELNKNFNTLFFTAKEFEKFIEENKKTETPIIVDDIHTVPTKYQRNIWEIIDLSLANNKQVCFSGNVAPRDIKNIDTKVLSRLEGGLVCDLQPPKKIVIVDMLKKKAEEVGINLPDDIVLELAQLSRGSIRTIDGMINRVKAYSSVGNVPLDLPTIRTVLKEFYPRGIYSPVSSLFEELRKDASSVLQNISEKLDIRDEYKEKIYIWEMKGFDTSSLKKILDGDINILEKEYENFIKKIERLNELQIEFSTLDTSEYPDETMKIESMLFSPDCVEEIEKLIAKAKKSIAEKEQVEKFGAFIIGKSNRKAYNIYQNQILKSLGEKFNPFIVFGTKGTGKTHFLKEINIDLKAHDKSVVLFDLAKEKGSLQTDIVNEAILILDNFHHITSLPDDMRKKIFRLIFSLIKKDIGIILGSGMLPSVLPLSEEESVIFDVGLEVELLKPSPDLAMAYIKSNLDAHSAKEIISKGLPEFASFYEIDDYIRPFKMVEVGAEVVPLGFPGEEAESKKLKEMVAPSDKKKVSISTEPKRVKPIREEEYIFPDVASELVEENY